MAAFRQTVQVIIDQELSPDVQRARFVAAAIGARDELIASGGASPRFATFADGQRGPETEARHSIVYQFNYVALAASYALGYLRARAPVRTGRLRDSFMVAVDGRPIRSADYDPEQVPESAEVIIYNTQPYSRKADVQFSGPVALHFSVPPGMFDDSASATQRAYAGVIKARRIGSVRFPGQLTRIRGGALIQSPALQLNPLL